MNTLAQPTPGTPRQLRHLLSRVWDVTSLYIPVALMLLLALASFWLLRSTPEPEPPPPERVVTSEPDNFMRGFSLRNFNADGSLRSEVFGTEARHHPDTGATVIDQARVRSYNDRKQLTTASARQITANEAGDVFVLEGQAVVIRQGGRDAGGKTGQRMEFHGDYLRATLKPDQLMSDRPVLMIRGSDQIQAQSLDYDGDARVAVLDGTVRAQFAPRP